MIRPFSMLGITALVVLSACKQESTLTQQEAQLEISPSLTDLGTVPVGETITAVIQLDHASGIDISIKNVVVTNIEGSFFSFTGETKQTLDREGSLDLVVTYSPTEVGYHRATLEVVHSGADSPAKVDVRARAILPEATLWPLGLDFGPVDVGASSQRALTVSNQSDQDLTISQANLSNNVFQMVTAVPFVVTGGNDLVVQLRFVPTDTFPQTGSLTLRAGSVALPQVALRGNDCENGNPEAYDEDGDGYTMCRGDCDDSNANVRPGAEELPNAVDDNCNGTVDEDTIWYDDDGDGYCEDSYCSDGSLPGDCSDSSDPSANTDMVNPGQAEIPDNGIDDDCDGVVDQGTTDADGDGYSTAGGDCDDTDPTSHPGAPELADGVNNDCDAFTDEGTILYDDDGDGYCEHMVACTDGSLPGDCDDDTNDMDGIGGPDGRPTYAGATEIYDWRDNDCDGTVDEGTDGYDDDGDGYTEFGGDCNDEPLDLDFDGVPDGALESPALGNCP